MTVKERKEVKRLLKSSVDKADKWIQMAAIGDELGVIQMPKESVKGRELVISELKSVKQEITEQVALLMADIDKAIDDMTC